ncbi:serine/threonine-protein kinase [Nocardiopsis gilva]|uniref:serine/threonine-protein kinase n=1 Tax=Nocardiopsis gilva TaxID=280236 RepID=UPI0018E03404|nr:serine/threonine-protein kinase [Nocardiopsis gilva]
MTSPLKKGDPANIGPYELSARIGKGGQGTVYLGRAPDGDEVAIKVLTSEWAGDARQRARFARELESARKVAPFCTAAVLDADLDAPDPYIVSEYVRGPNLREAVLQDGPRRGSALDRLAIATATALVAIHQAGVVHRDFKPANVLLSDDGPRVIDFGIARSSDSTITQTNSVTGTPAYMAPEQIRGADIGPPADMFAWAGVIAFAAAGNGPFAADSVHTVIHRILSEPPDLAEVPDNLRPLLAACLSKDPEQRPTAAKVLGLLVGHDFTDGAPASGPADPVTAVLQEGATAAVNEQTRIETIEIYSQGQRPGPAVSPVPTPPTEEATERQESRQPTRHDSGARGAGTETVERTTSRPEAGAGSGGQETTTREGRVPGRWLGARRTKREPSPAIPLDPAGRSGSEGTGPRHGTPRRFGRRLLVGLSLVWLLLLGGAAVWALMSDGGIAGFSTRISPSDGTDPDAGTGGGSDTGGDGGADPEGGDGNQPVNDGGGGNGSGGEGYGGGGDTDGGAHEEGGTNDGDTDGNGGGNGDGADDGHGDGGGGQNGGGDNGDGGGGQDGGDGNGDGGAGNGGNGDGGSGGGTGGPSPRGPDPGNGGTNGDPPPPNTDPDPGTRNDPEPNDGPTGKQGAEDGKDD